MGGSMKKLLLVLVIGIVLGITASANAALITIGTSGETKIYQIYNARYDGIDYVSNSALEAQENNAAISAGLFTEASTGGTIYFVARYAGDTHSLYAYNTSDLNGSDVGFSDSDSIGTHYHIPSSINDPFGFRLYDANSGSTNLSSWYSQKSLNSDGEYHFLVLNTPNPNRFLVGVEDRTTGTGADWDYNDVVFEFRKIYPVPEPASMSLLGLGLLGALGAGFRRKK